MPKIKQFSPKSPLRSEEQKLGVLCFQGHHEVAGTGSSSVDSDSTNTQTQFCGCCKALNPLTLLRL